MLINRITCIPYKIMSTWHRNSEDDFPAVQSSLNPPFRYYCHIWIHLLPSLTMYHHLFWKIYWHYWSQSTCEELSYSCVPYYVLWEAIAQFHYIDYTVDLSLFVFSCTFSVHFLEMTEGQKYLWSILVSVIGNLTQQRSPSFDILMTFGGLSLVAVTCCFCFISVRNLTVLIFLDKL